jgi:hypothetical protein
MRRKYIMQPHWVPSLRLEGVALLNGVSNWHWIPLLLRFAKQPSTRFSIIIMCYVLTSRCFKTASPQQCTHCQVEAHNSGDSSPFSLITSFNWYSSTFSLDWLAVNLLLDLASSHSLLRTPWTEDPILMSGGYRSLTQLHSTATVTLQLVIYHQPLRFDSKPFEAHDQGSIFIFFAIEPFSRSPYESSSLTRGGWVCHLCVRVAFVKCKHHSYSLLQKIPPCVYKSAGPAYLNLPHASTAAQSLERS